MRKLALLIPGLCCAAVVTAIAMQGVFTYVKATSQGEEVVLQWRTTTDANVHSFEIERKSDEVTDFRRIGVVGANGGNGLYTYTDNGAFFKSQAGKVFTYRVKAVGGTYEQFSREVEITHEVSSVRRSWGMIKELFR